MRRIQRAVLIVAAALWLPAAPAASQTEAAKPYVPVGLFFGAIEEGARIFTPARLLPFEHPDALGHEFPTVLQLYGSEFPMLLWLGEQAGFRLGPTLQRYPTEPAGDWPYPDFRPPPDTTALHRAVVSRRLRAVAPLPGLRAALFDGSQLVAFLVDTRGLSLAERGMSRPTSMGLDLARVEFLRRVTSAAPPPSSSGLVAVIWVP